MSAKIMVPVSHLRTTDAQSTLLAATHDKCVPIMQTSQHYQFAPLLHIIIALEPIHDTYVKHQLQQLSMQDTSQNEQILYLQCTTVGSTTPARLRLTSATKSRKLLHSSGTPWSGHDKYCI
jgi:hypothetical protein